MAPSTGSHRLGTVNVIDREPRPVTAGQTAILNELAGLVMQQLDLRLSAMRAVRAERELREDADRRAERSAELAAQMQSAMATASQLEHPGVCELGGRQPCPKRGAEGRRLVGRLRVGVHDHAEEVIMHVSSVFVADETLGGLGAYIRR